MAILWSLMVRFTADHFSMPVMRLDCAVKPFMFRVAILIVALIAGGLDCLIGVFGSISLGVGWYGCVPSRGSLMRPSFCPLWPEGGVGAVADVLGRGIDIGLFTGSRGFF